MNQQNLSSLLKDFDQQLVENFVAYCHKLETAKKKEGNNWVIKNPWMNFIKDEKLATMFKNVDKEGLVFDGVDITLQKTGVSYNYKAFKNKMLISYPESTIDVSVVYRKDEYEFAKKDGKVFYTHTVSDPFDNDDSEIKGAYCIIKNKRGEFLTTLTRLEIEKHRKVAKTDNIWQQWYKEMVMKTVIKKACGLHFRDIFQSMETTDNENYDVENPLDLDLKFKQEIDEIETIDDLKDYYLKNKGKGKSFDKYVTKKKAELKKSLEKGCAKKDEKQPKKEEKPLADEKKGGAQKESLPKDTAQEIEDNLGDGKDLKGKGFPPKTCPKCDAPSGGVHDKDCPNWQKPLKDLIQ